MKNAKFKMVLKITKNKDLGYKFPLLFLSDPVIVPKLLPTQF